VWPLEHGQNLSGAGECLPVRVGARHVTLEPLPARLSHDQKGQVRGDGNAVFHAKKTAPSGIADDIQLCFTIGHRELPSKIHVDAPVSA